MTNSETDEKKSISTISIRNTEAVTIIQRDGSAISAVVIEAKRSLFWLIIIKIIKTDSHDSFQASSTSRSRLWAILELETVESTVL